MITLHNHGERDNDHDGYNIDRHADRVHCGAQCEMARDVTKIMIFAEATNSARKTWPRRSGSTPTAPPGTSTPSSGLLQISSENSFDIITIPSDNPAGELPGRGGGPRVHVQRPDRLRGRRSSSGDILRDHD